MTNRVNELLQAIHLRLAGDIGFAALCPGGIHDRRLDRAAMPYLLAGQVEARDFSTATETAEEIFLTLEAWSADGRMQAETIAARVRALLHDTGLSLATMHLANLRYISAQSRREAKTALFVAAVRFRALVE